MASPRAFLGLPLIRSKPIKRLGTCIKEELGSVITGIRAPSWCLQGKGNHHHSSCCKFMVSTRSQTRTMENWVKEKEDMRSRIELNEARTKKTEDLLVDIALKLGITVGEEDSGDNEEVESHEVQSTGDKWRKINQLIVESVADCGISGSWDPCKLILLRQMVNQRELTLLRHLASKKAPTLMKTMCHNIPWEKRFHNSVLHLLASQD
ncbi:hypothetical protein Lal_00024802 [Lupinus albus]|nr:hypothetical protein Lal_00024802 [Lupinus albus]